jgi:hypothetical protein
LVVVKLIKITPHTRLKRTQPPPTMDRIILVIVDGLVRGATNEPMTSLSKDQLESLLDHGKNCSNPAELDTQLALMCKLRYFNPKHYVLPF